MFVPVFTLFGIENSSQHSGRPRTFLALMTLIKLFFILFCDPRVSTRGITSRYNSYVALFLCRSVLRAQLINMIHWLIFSGLPMEYSLRVWVKTTIINFSPGKTSKFHIPIDNISSWIFSYYSKTTDQCTQLNLVIPCLVSPYSTTISSV